MPLANYLELSAQKLTVKELLESQGSSWTFFQALIYRIYTMNGEKLFPDPEHLAGADESWYFVVQSEQLPGLLRSEQDLVLKKQQLEQRLETEGIALNGSRLKVEATIKNYQLLIEMYDQLKLYDNLAAFFRVDLVDYAKAGVAEIDAMRLMNWEGWPEGKVAYFSQFTPNHLLPKEYREQVLTILFKQALESIPAEYHGNMFIILADHVRSLVESVGLVVEKVEGSSRKLAGEDAEADKVFDGWPEYWKNGNPNLYRIVEFVG